MNSDQISALIRHLITSAGAVLVTNGVINHSQLADAAGAVTALAMIAWSIWQKTHAKQEEKAVKIVNATANIVGSASDQTVTILPKSA